MSDLHSRVARKHSPLFGPETRDSDKQGLPDAKSVHDLDEESLPSEHTVATAPRPPHLSKYKG